MMTYLIEFALMHILFYVVYKVLLSKETQLGFLRFFLVGSTILALTIPLIEIPTPPSLPAMDVGTTILPKFSVSQDVAETTSITWYEILFVFVSVIFTSRFVYGILRILLFRKRSQINTVDGIEVCEIPNMRTSFTFMKWIFIDTSHFENPRDIVQHELGHAKKLHTIDMLFFHLLTVAFWWLPSIWLMIKELKEVHEFEADAYALSRNNETYAKTLVQCTLKAHGMSLASSFDDAPIFNRLNFMKKMKKKISTWKVASIAALVAISGAMFACEDELESEIKRIAEESNQQIDYSDDVKTALAELKKSNPDVEYAVVETSLENEASIEKLNSYDPGQIAKIFVNKEGDKKSVVMIVSQDSDLFDKTMQVQKDNGEVYTIVEESASFPGGLDAFYAYMSENLKYPKDAIEAKKEGRVFVQFVVEKDGSLTDVHVVKGMGGSCDKEAVRVVMQSPNWIPGKVDGEPVRMKMIQNIEFKLPG